MLVQILKNKFLLLLLMFLYIPCAYSQTVASKTQLPAATMFTDQTNTAAAGSVFDFSAITSTAGFKFPSQAGNTASAFGSFDYDLTNNNYHGYNGADVIFAPLAAGFVTGHCGQPTATSGSWVIADAGAGCGTGGGGSGTVSSGTTPRLTYYASSGTTVSDTGANLTWVSPTLTIGVAGSTTGILKLGSSTAGSVSLTPAAAASAFTLTLPAVTDTIAGIAATQTLTNKTLTAPVISSIVNTGTLTLPTATGTIFESGGSNIAASGATFNFANITSTAGLTVPIAAGETASAFGVIDYDSTNNNYHVYNGADRILVPLAAGFVSGDCGQPTVASGKWTISDAGAPCGSGGGGGGNVNAGVSPRLTYYATSGTTVSDTGANLTWVTPTLTIGSSGTTTGILQLASSTATGSVSLTPASAASNFTLTLPAVTDTLVGLAATQNLTNKTLTSPTLVTAALGTPASGVMTNVTGLPLTTGVTGALPIANGGVNATSAAAGTIPNATSGSAASWTATPTLGASGTLGSVTMGNATSGTVTIAPVTGALGAVTVSVPATTGTMFISAGTNTAAAGAVYNLSAITSTAGFKVPVAAGETTTAAGVIDFDSTNNNFHGFVNGADSIFANFAVAPTTNVIPKASISSGNTLLTNSTLTDNGTTVTTSATGGFIGPSFTSNSSTAGFFQCTAGSANGHSTASTITLECPAAATAYEVVLPGAASTGFVTWTNASGVVTESITATATLSVTVNGQTCTLGSTCTINPPFDKSSVGLANPTADAIFTQPGTSTTGWTFAGTAPASVSTSTGTAATTLFNVNGVIGGATSNASGTAGAGSAPTITAGAGGAGTGTNAVGGAGGGITLAAGNGGASNGTGNNSIGGSVTIAPGTAGTGGSGTTGKAGVLAISGTGAGFNYFTQGADITTSNTNIPGNSIIEEAPTSVTAYKRIKPGAAATGLLHLANSAGVVTESISAVSLTADISGVLPFANMSQYWQPNPKTSTYQVLAADFAGCATIPVASGTFNITLVASGSQPAAGQCIFIINYGSGVVTVVRSGQDINGGTSSLTVPAGSATSPSGAFVVSDGTNYEAQVFANPSAAVSSLTGDGALITNSGSTGSVTLTLGTTSAHHFWGGAAGSGGVPTFVQPAFTDLSGSVACGQMPALTGDTTTSAGACATTTAKINGTSFPTSAAVIGSNGSAQPIAATPHQVVAPLQCADTSSSATTYTCTTSPSIASLNTGDTFIFTSINQNNSGSSTLNIDTIGAKTIKKNQNTSNLASGDLQASATVTLIYDGTNFEIDTIGNGAVGVSSFSGDGGLLSNSSSTGAVTATLATAGAHKYWGNNTGSTAAPAYYQPAFTDLSGSLACGQTPALTGDTTTSAGSCATTTAKINGAAFPTSAGVIGANSSAQAVSATAHGVSTPLACDDTSASGTAQSCTSSPSFTPASGDAILYATTTTNTGDVTTNVNSLGAKHIRKNFGAQTLGAGDLVANVPTLLVYDGTYWEISTTGNVFGTGTILDSTLTLPGTSTSGLTLAGTAPASVSTSTGTTASTVFIVSGVAGGASSNATGTGGVGSTPAISAGAGGAGTGTNAVGGAGGAVNLTAGNGGASNGTGANSNGGNIVATLGAAGTGGSGTAGKAGVFSVSGTGAGFNYFTQGTAITTSNTAVPANSIIEQAPTSVTAYTLTKPSAAPTNNFSSKTTTTGGTESYNKMQQMAMVTSQYTNATTSYTNVTGLSFPIDASSNYAVSCKLVYQSSATTAGMILTSTGPASPTAVSASLLQTLTNGTSPTFDSTSTHGTTFAIALGDGTIVSTATDMRAILDVGIVNGSTAGTWQLQAKANGTGTVTIQIGSYCVLQ